MKMSNPADDNQKPHSGSKNTHDMNAVERPAQPILDKYRSENKFERHPPKNNKKITPCAYNDPNTVGMANLQRQIDISAEQSNESVDGL